mmetsp:Transcript_75697/g.244964  ORF Transcript_75697/g.244964 Transcript_75697/m.244964 type:complete len:346 (-) Transcript_75697:396-1433(-)
MRAGRWADRDLPIGRVASVLGSSRGGAHRPRADVDEVEGRLEVGPGYPESAIATELRPQAPPQLRVPCPGLVAVAPAPVPAPVVAPGVSQEEQPLAFELHDVQQRVGVRLHEAVGADVLRPASGPDGAGDEEALAVVGDDLGPEALRVPAVLRARRPLEVLLAAGQLHALPSALHASGLALAPRPDEGPLLAGEGAEGGAAVPAAELTIGAEHLGECLLEQQDPCLVAVRPSEEGHPLIVPPLARVTRDVLVDRQGELCAPSIVERNLALACRQQLPVAEERLNCRWEFSQRGHRSDQPTVADGALQEIVGADAPMEKLPRACTQMPDRDPLGFPAPSESGQLAQ